MKETFTLLAIDRINGERVRQYKTKPQKGLTEEELENIVKKETKKLYSKHPEMSHEEKIKNLFVCLLYKSDVSRFDLINGK